MDINKKTPEKKRIKNLVSDELFLLELKNKLDTIKYKDPFKKVYEGLISKRIKNYIAHIFNTNLEEDFKYKFPPTSFEEVVEYSTDKIPVFFRKQKEALTYLFENNYYEDIRFNDIVINDENIKKYNPHLYDSFHYNDYIVSSTIVPKFPRDLIIFGINYETRRHYTSMDFYFDPTFLIDMFIISFYLNSFNGKYIIFNSLESGSLFENYHFHIFESEISEMQVKFRNDIDPDEEFKMEDVCQKVYGKIDNAFGDGYVINLSHPKFYDILYNLPELLYDLRLSDDKQYKYASQVFIFEQDDKQYLFLTFRKVPINVIKLVNGKIIQDYWDALYGTLAKKKNVVYLPIGIINYNSKNKVNPDVDLINLLQDEDLLRDMKSAYHHHPDLEKKLLLAISKKSSNVKNSIVNKPFETPLDVCINLKNDLIKNKVNNYSCSKLPILYNFGERNILGQNVENGLMLIDGAYFYYIKTNSILENELVNKQILNEEKDLKEIILTNYTAIKNVAGNYFLYNPVRTYLIDYIGFLKRDSNLINSFIVMIVYKFIQLHKKGIRLENLDINKFYLVENNLKVIDYVFNDTVIVSIGKEHNANCKYKILHNGLEVFFPFEVKKEVYDVRTLLYDIKTIINQLQENGITNSLLDDINSTNNLDTIIYKFAFGIDYFECKSQNREVFNRIKEYVFYGNDDNIWNKIVERLKSTPNLDEIKYLKIETDDFFISSINGTDTNLYALNELKYKIYNQPTYFLRVLDNKIDLSNRLYTNYFDLYANWNSNSRVYYYKANKPIKLIELKLEFESYYDIINTIFGLTKEQLERFKKEVTQKYYLQEMINFGLSIKYPDLAGYKMNGNYDEYIFFRKSEYLSLYTIAKLNKNYFELFYDYNTYIDNMKNLVFEEYDKVSNKNFNKYYVWLTQKIIKDYNINKTFLEKDSILNKNYDFYTLPRLDSKVVFFDELERIEGNNEYYKAKYEKYKNRYLKLKKLMLN
jgi:hypothetical protein